MNKSALIPSRETRSGSSRGIAKIKNISKENSALNMTHQYTSAASQRYHHSNAQQLASYQQEKHSLVVDPNQLLNYQSRYNQKNKENSYSFTNTRLHLGEGVSRTDRNIPAISRLGAHYGGTVMTTYLSEKNSKILQQDINKTSHHIGREFGREITNEQFKRSYTGSQLAHQKQYAAQQQKKPATVATLQPASR